MKVHTTANVERRLYVRLVNHIVLTILACAGCAVPAGAQTSALDPQSVPEGIQLRVGYEASRDHLRYTFENRSNIDTDFPVPHAFTQRYVANNHWLFASARYSIRSDVMETELAFTPERQTRGSDLDTFFDPNDDVVVSGTTGDVMLRSVRCRQWSEGRLFGLAWRVGYTFRRDRSQFLPTDRIVTHSNPVSETRTPTFGHETTISQVHEFPIQVSRPLSVAGAWTLIPTADVSPLVFARLITKLPDKYPGRDIVFDARSVGLGGGVQLLRRQGWPIAVSVHYGQTWGYRAARQFRRDSLTGSLTLGLGT